MTQPTNENHKLMQDFNRKHGTDFFLLVQEKALKGRVEKLSKEIDRVKSEKDSDKVKSCIENLEKYGDLYNAYQKWQTEQTVNQKRALDHISKGGNL